MCKILIKYFLIDYFMKKIILQQNYFLITSVYLPKFVKFLPFLSVIIIFHP